MNEELRWQVKVEDTVIGIVKDWKVVDKRDLPVAYDLPKCAYMPTKPSIDLADNGDYGMGLDVYLWKCSDIEAHKDKEKRLDDFEENIWKEYDYEKMTDDEKNEVRASINAFTKVLGIDRDRT